MESGNNPDNQNEQNNDVATTDDVNIEMKDINDDGNTNELSAEATSSNKDENNNDASSSEQKKDDSAPGEVGGIDKPSDFQELLPWIVIACVGLVLLIVACAVFATSGPPAPKPIVIPKLKLPQIHGSMKVTQIDGEDVYYEKSLSLVVNSKAQELAVKLRPKITKVYVDSGVPADDVLILAFKYKDKDSEIGDNPGVFVTHWVYLKDNQKITIDAALIGKVKSTATAKGADIGLTIDSESIDLLKTTNMTQADAVNVLSQHNFFSAEILENLDTGLLGSMGIQVQAEDDEGFCAAFDDIDLLVTRTVSPMAECMDTDKTFPGLKCTFGCKKGYSLKGSAIRYCLPDGLWSGEAAFCEADCDALSPAPMGATFPSSCGEAASSSGQFCFTQCRPSAVLMVAGQDEHVDTAAVTSEKYHVRQCRNGEWINGPGLCVEKCPLISAPQHSTFSDSSCATQPHEGQSCVVVCDSGYILPGGGDTQQVSCNMGGTWSDGLVDCIKTCPALSASANLVISPSVCTGGTPFDGIQCDFECAAGYTLQGKSFSVCNADGSWSHVAPTCLQHCNAIPSVMNGMLASDIGDCQNPIHGTKCSLLCDSGFIISQSSNDTTCTNGAWSNDPSNFKCSRSCPPLSESSGTWSPAECSTGAYDLSDGSCDLTCDAGFTAVGASTVTCNTNSGFWKSEPAVCKKLCPARTVTANLKVYPASCASASEAGVECNFYCDPMFELTSGPTTTTCNTDGTWSDGVIPTCSGNAAKEYVVKSVYSDSAASYCLVPDVACATVEKLYDMTQCQNGGVRLGSDKFFKNTWTTSDGDTIKSTDCQKCISDDGGLSISLATCASSDSKQKLSSGSRGQIVSKAGNMLSSTFHTHDLPFFSDLSIQWNTQWSFTYNNAETTTLDGTRNSMACEQSALEASIIDRNDMTITVSGTSATIACGSSKQLSVSSQSTVTCTDGLWAVSSWLHCYSTSSSCDEGSVSLQTGVKKSDCSTTIGGYCKLSCEDKEKYVIGPTSISCVTGGRWQSQETSYCKSFCPALTAPANGYFIGGNSRHCTSGLAKVGDSCDVACEVGYALQGSSSMSCNQDGAWFSAVPTCVKMCELNVKKIDNVIISGCTDQGSHMYKPGSTCKFSCPHGYALSPVNSLAEVSRTCTSNSTWDVLPIPECAATCSPIVESSTFTTTVSPSACSTPIAGMACNISCEDSSFISDGVAVYPYVTRTCTNSRLWNGHFDVCQKYCPPIDKQSSKAVVGPVTCTSAYQQPGTVCTLYCPENNVPSGHTVATCTQHGNWSYSGGDSDDDLILGKCLSKCGALTKYKFTTITPKACVTGPVEPGTSCEITCPPGYTRVGPGFMTCNGVMEKVYNPERDGYFWSGEKYSKWSHYGSPYCKAVCPQLQIPQGMKVLPATCSYESKLPDDKCSFFCPRTHVLTGSRSTSCLSSGQWSNEVPACNSFCAELRRLPNAWVKCDRSKRLIAPGSGYAYKTGTWCKYGCKEGYVANQASDISCTDAGWSPSPYCSQVSPSTGVWRILQHDALGKTTCIGATSDASGWKPAIHNKYGHCRAWNKHPYWTWYKGTHLRHTTTGLCLTAKASRSGSGVWLTHCEEDYQLQKWSCDVYESYRIVLQNTNIGLTSTYVEAGPILSDKATADTFWISLNKDLDSHASICSFKTKGICPPITGNYNYTVTPSICTSENVEVWQKCDVSCKDSHISPRGAGVTYSVQCTPRGVWKGIGDAKCIPRIKCPPFSRNSASAVTPESCYSPEGVDHGVDCESKCLDGYKDVNGMTGVAVSKCHLGEWNGAPVACASNTCEPAKLAPVNGAVSCNADDECTITCNTGYTLTDDSYSKRMCDGSPLGDTKKTARLHAMGRSATPQPATGAVVDATPQPSGSSSTTTKTTTTTTASGAGASGSGTAGPKPKGVGPFDKCELVRESQFMIKLQTASIHGVSSPCLTNSSDCMSTVKAACSKSDPTMFWKWSGDRLQHVVSGKCLTIDSTTEELILNSCDNNKTEEWNCNDVNNPYHIFGNSNPSSYIDAGSVDLNTPARMRSAPFFGSGKWFGVDATESLVWSMFGKRESWPSTVCSYKIVARCPPLSLPFGASSSSTCNLEVGETCTFTCNTDYTLSPSTSQPKCKTNGLWDQEAPTCVYKDNTNACPSLSLDHNTIAWPANCNSPDAIKKGSVCRFKCKHGYVLDGSSEVTCNSSGAWSTAAPSCKALCSNLIHPHHVVYDSPSCDYLQVKEGTVCAQSCAPGYAAQYATAKTCLASGEYDHSDMKCTRGCTNLLGWPYKATTNATLVIEGTHNVVTSERCIRGQLAGDSCTFSCPSSDYTLVDGPAEQTCLSDSSFLYPIAQCVKNKVCPDIAGDGIDSVSYSPKRGGVATDVGTVATYTCSAGYTAAESTRRVCQADGTWSGSSVFQFCEKLCQPLQKSIGLNYKRMNCTTMYQKEGATCGVSCASDLVATTTLATCSNGTWDAVPQCTLTDRSTLNTLNILSNTSDEFMLRYIWSNRNDRFNCLKRVEKNNIVWAMNPYCQRDQRGNRFKWSGNLIKHIDDKDNLCLKIRDMAALPKRPTYVELATCNHTDVAQQWICGSTENYHRFTLQPKSESHMITRDPYGAWTPPFRWTMKMQISRITGPRHLYTPFHISANAATNNPYATDKSVCSVSCGGSFTGRSGENGFIISPGYRGYGAGAPFIECDWSFMTLGSKTTLTVTELQLKDSSDNDGCGLDCIEIFESIDGSISNARNYHTFRGNDLSAYNPGEKGNAVVTTTGNLYVRFKTNTISADKGFIIRFDIEDAPQQPTTCGRRNYTEPNTAFGSYPEDKALDSMNPQLKSFISKDNVWPWVVSIREVDSRNGIHRCSGILVDNSTIISAAHCAHFMLRTMAHNINTYVSVNITNQYHMDDEWKLGIKYKVDRFFVHPEYDAVKRTHDIAVWKISAQSPITLDVPPLCLTLDDYLPYHKMSTCYAVGWSPITKGPTLHLLKEYLIELDSPYWCKTEFGLPIEDQIICAKYAGLDGTGSLSTDDSEPLLCQNNDGAIYFAGVAAYTHIGREFNRRIYTSINAEKTWLNQILASSQLTMASQGYERLVLTQKDEQDYKIIQRNDMKWQQFF